MVKYFRNKKTNEEIRWDPAIYRNESKLLIGRGGLNHWHRINPNKDSLNNYLDKKGEKCSILSEESAIIPDEQVVNEKLIAIGQNEDTLNITLKALINILDLRTENWFHDAIISSLDYVDHSLFISIKHSRNNQIIESFFEFKNASFSYFKDLENLVGSEINFPQIISVSDQKSQLIFKIVDNSDFQIDFSKFEYSEL